MTPKNNENRNVNISLDILKQYSDSKERKELLATGIAFHLWRSNGVVWNVTYRNLMEWLHIGKKKAKRLIVQMETDPMFDVNGTKVSVHSFRDKTQKRTKKGRRYSGAVCALIKANRDYTLKELYDIINDLLLLARIKATTGLTPYPIEDSVQPRSYLTCRSLAKTIGMGRSSVSRITKRLKDNGTIIKDPAIICAVLGMEHATEIKCILHRLGYHSISFQKGSNAWIVIPCGYAINDPEVLHSIRHKIYGYHKNGHAKVSATSIIPQFCE